MVLIMSINPGFGGQAFIEEMLTKAKQAKKLIDATGRDVILEIDGGVKIDNVAQIAAAGVDAFVAGSAVFNTPDYAKTIAALRAQLSLCN